MDDLAVIIISTNEAHWLEPCLTTLLAGVGDISVDVVVMDNGSTDETAELVGREFPEVRVVRCENYGFGHANNRGYVTTHARYVLFLNPDTEVRHGTFEELVARLDLSPTVGLAGVKQVTPDGALFPTIRRFPNAVRALWQALGSERYPFRASWLGERELDLGRYEAEFECDWTSGSFNIVRREALEGAGLFDERFFLFSDETDLCLRIRKAGWRVMHVPTMTILHHANKAGANPRLEAQGAFSRRLYGRKHFSPAHRAAYLAALTLGYALRSALTSKQRRQASRAALATLWGLRPPPFGAPPSVALPR